MERERERERERKREREKERESVSYIKPELNYRNIWPRILFENVKCSTNPGIGNETTIDAVILLWLPVHGSSAIFLPRSPVIAVSSSFLLPGPSTASMSDPLQMQFY